MQLASCHVGVSIRRPALQITAARCRIANENIQALIPQPEGTYCILTKRTYYCVGRRRLVKLQYLKFCSSPPPEQNDTRALLVLTVRTYFSALHICGHARNSTPTRSNRMLRCSHIFTIRTPLRHSAQSYTMQCGGRKDSFFHPGYNHSANISYDRSWCRGLEYSRLLTIDRPHNSEYKKCC